MVKIRLTRLGRHKLPYFRIVAIDSKSRRDGSYIKLLGTYEPFEGKVEILEEEVLHFLSQGAQPSDTVRSILKEKGIWKKFADAKLKSKMEKNKEKPKKESNSKKNSVNKAAKSNAKAVKSGKK
ncbi:MAG: 30S ribosomal protein S16 [Mycoplasma sp.]|nr:30S ribosomal protein S16 [Mycoplasma sp.]